MACYPASLWAVEPPAGECKVRPCDLFGKRAASNCNLAGVGFGGFECQCC